jgi:hypothetical protein
LLKIKWRKKMRVKEKYILTDVERGIWVDHFEISSEIKNKWSIIKRTFRGGLSDGVDIVEIVNGALSFSILPTRGMGIWRGKYNDTFLGWKSPVSGPVHPKFVHALERGGTGWLQGFDELLVRCGLESFGAPSHDVVSNALGNGMKVALTLHGRIANLPASLVEILIEEDNLNKEILTIHGVVDEARLFGPVLRLVSRTSTVVGGNSIYIEDTIINMGGKEQEFEILYHWNLGSPLLEEGATLITPAIEVVPRDSRAAEGIKSYHEYSAPIPGFAEQVYFYKLASNKKGDTLVMLKNKKGNKGFVCRFNLSELPCFTQWKYTSAISEGYVTGIEPGTNYPNPRPFERTRGRLLALQPNESYKINMKIEYVEGEKEVGSIENEILQLTGHSLPKIYEVPQPEFSPPEA